MTANEAHVLEDKDRVAEMAVAMCVFAVDVLEMHMSKEAVAKAALDQLDKDLFDEPLVLDDTELDSMGLVELLASVEAEFDISLFDQDDVETMTTLRGLVEHTIATARPEAVEAFLTTWRR